MNTILYLLAAALVVTQLFGLPGIVIALLLIIIILLLNRIDSVHSLEEIRETINAKISEIGKGVNATTQQINELKSNTEKNVFSLESSISEVKTDYRLEMESQYRELARKIIDVENHLLEIRKTVGAAFGSLEDRLENINKDF